VVIDAYADWCIPCKELDKFTFSDPAVRQLAASLVTMKLNLTRDEPETEAGKAKLRFRIQGVPTIIFLDSTGQERNTLRLEGFEGPGPFLERLKALQNPP
jgi:thiol:disulfide interchange protein DsbD